MKRKTIAIILFCIVAFAGLGFLGKVLILDRRVNAFSGLKVDSIPQADVYIDEKSVGKTPYENSKLTPGEYVLKLSVTGVAGNYYPWETKIKLVPQSLTYVNRIIGENDSESGHQIVWLEKLANSNSKELAVVSSPGDALIEVDGLDEGRTSKIITNLSSGDHRIVVSKAGYSDMVIDGKIVSGYRLNISVKLAKMSGDLEEIIKVSSSSAKVATSSAKVASNSATSTVEDDFPKPYILVKETGIGFLRVRSGPSTTAAETAQADIGAKFPLLSEETGWVEIKIGTASGWVSDQYVEKVK